MPVLRAVLVALLPGLVMFLAAPIANAAADVVAQTNPQPDAWGCYRWKGLSRDQAQRIAEIAAAVALQANVMTSTGTVPTFWVFLPASSHAAAKERAAELERAGVKNYFIVQRKGPQPFAISLGASKSRAQANALVERLRRKGIGDAQVIERGEPAKTEVDVRGPLASIAAVTEKIGLEVPEARGAPCSDA